MDKHLMKFLSFLGFIFGSFFNIAVILALVGFVYYASIRSFQFAKEYSASLSEEKLYKEVNITIEDNSTLKEVSEVLHNKGLIKNALFFQLENFIVGNDKPFKGGEFVLNTQMDTNALIAELRNVKVISVDKRITIQEGRTLKEIAQYLESLEIVSAEDFIETCNTAFFDYDFLTELPERENYLEGYLFPDTYYVSERADSYEIINKMLSNFEAKFDNELMKKAEEMGLTMDETIIIASVIEKEINREDERAKAASVIYNRLNIKMNLQMCSTILYVLDKRKDRLLDADLEVPSPYNTYMNPGLPIGPIANPGLACIKAALNPIQSDLLYFVVKNEETGEHAFTHDYNDFLKAKAQYNQKY